MPLLVFGDVSHEAFVMQLATFLARNARGASAGDTGKNHRSTEGGTEKR